MKLDINNEEIMEQLGFPFYYWAICGQFSITEQDIKYIQGIKNHPCFPIIAESYQITYPILAWANKKINEIVFYEHFYKDPNCPSGVKNILFSIIGLGRGNLEENHMSNLLYFRYHSAELWINSMTKKALLR